MIWLHNHTTHLYLCICIIILLSGHTFYFSLHVYQQLGQNHNDSVKVPFTLPPGAQNEGQFAFTVEDITAPQKLRGTLTYILKSSDGATQEKVDFRISLPCSAYLMTSPCKRSEKWTGSCLFSVMQANGSTI